MRLKGQRSPGQAKRVAQRSREEADPWLEPRVGRVEAETEVPERGKARPGVHGAPPSQLAGGAADEDVVARGVYHPVVALPRVVVVPRHLSIGIIISPVNFGFLQVENLFFNSPTIADLANRRKCYGYTIKYRLQRENTNLDEAFVETEVVPNGVLPTLLVVLVIRELHCNVLVDACNIQDFKIKYKLQTWFTFQTTDFL